MCRLSISYSRAFFADRPTKLLDSACRILKIRLRRVELVTDALCAFVRPVFCEKPTFDKSIIPGGKLVAARSLRQEKCSTTSAS